MDLDADTSTTDLLVPEAALGRSDQTSRQYLRLRADILAGKFPQGSPLHETQLCESYGASRTPIREALNWLAHDGLHRTSRPRFSCPLRHSRRRHRNLRSAGCPRIGSRRRRRTPPQRSRPCPPGRIARVLLHCNRRHRGSCRKLQVSRGPLAGRPQFHDHLIADPPHHPTANLRQRPAVELRRT